MKIQKDKIQHLVLGIIWLVVSLISMWIYNTGGLGPSLAWSTTVFGIGYEVNQWIRKEGQPDPWDALATSIPGWIAWIVIYHLPG